MANDTLQALLDEQRKTNELLAMLIEAMADEGDDERPVMRHLDGTPA